MTKQLYVYIHVTSEFLDNKRLDEWVPEERMDMSKLEPPRKDQKTPKKEVPSKIGSGPGSRQSSPEREIILVVRFIPRYHLPLLTFP